MLAALIWTTASASSPAFAADAPDLSIGSAKCYRSILEADDLFCLSDYELPVALTDSPVSPEAWCAELVDTTGCTDRAPLYPTTLETGAAYVTLYDGADILGQSQVPRIGLALGGTYLAAGHAVTWGNTNITACVESSRTAYDTFTQACLNVLWSAAANTEAAQRADLAQDLLALLQGLEALDPFVETNGYVINSLITSTGRVLALEALSLMDRILIDTFQSQAVQAVTTDFTPGTGLALQSNIDATATAVVGAFQGLGTDFGVPTDAVGITLFTVVGIIMFAVVQRVAPPPGNMPLAVVAFLTVVLIGVQLGAVPVAVVAVMTILLAALAAAFLIRKVALS